MNELDADEHGKTRKSSTLCLYQELTLDVRVMSLAGPDFYDDEEVFETYMAHRERGDNPNDTLEKPVLIELLGDLNGKRILDLGCGDAAIGKEALQRGCAAYVGIEGSQNMLALAVENLAGTQGRVVQANLEDWEPPREAFDLVLSRLVFHYLSGLEAVLGGAQQALVPGGRIVFSVEHPVITSCDRAWQGQGLRQDWIVDNYFESGRRETQWLGGRVIKIHRTVEDYYLALQRAGFVVESLREARPQRAQFSSEETYLRRMRIPLFLFLAGRKA
jgi:SAM-dependent methyltransferase